MDLGLRDKVILVTGGGAGIGEGISRACLEEGARVVVLGRASDQVLHFMEDMRAQRALCDLLPVELSDDRECKIAVRRVLDTYGEVFGVVNNAGANDGVGLEDGTPEAFLQSLRRNLVHYYSVVHYALPALKAARGAVVNISSKVAVTGQGGTSAYAAAKGAQLALTREWAAELLPYGVRVNSVLPAEVMTPLYRRWIDSFPDPEARIAAITQRIPLDHRMTTSAEIASTTVFLLSPTQSGHTTGQHLSVDGGYVHLDRSLT